jgi:hypothetical protein
MPAMNKEDIDDLNLFVKAGRIDEARALLMRFDGEKAQTALRRLNEKFPLVATKAARPAPRSASSDMPPELRLDEMDEIKLAIQERRFADAQSMLVVSDHPDAEKMLARLAQITGTPASAAPVKQKANKSNRKRLLYALLVVLLVLVVVVVMPMIADMNAQADAINRQINAMR